MLVGSWEEKMYTLGNLNLGLDFTRVVPVRSKQPKLKNKHGVRLETSLEQLARIKTKHV